MKGNTCGNCEFFIPGTMLNDGTRYHTGKCVNLKVVNRFPGFSTHNNSYCSFYSSYEKTSDPFEQEEELRKAMSVNLKW